MALQVFISYKREDQSFAEQLHQHINAWGHRSWLDVVDIPAGTTPDMRGWDDAIHQGMKDSQVVIGVLTPESLKSPNVLDEWAWALENQRRLFLLWLRDVSPVDIPPRYIRIQRIDLRKNAPSGLQKLQSALATPTLTLPDEHTRPAPKSTAKSPPQPSTNRALMLDKVHEFWVIGVLENALKESGAFELGLSVAPNAVLKHIHYGDYQLPSSAGIGEVFNDLNRELLILGAPGAGKTILLLQLARHLIERARADETQPIPVVFNLSSWAAEQKPLQDWLIDELRLKYQVSKILAQTWIERERLLLLLDGLDEVAIEVRNFCVQAINRFRHDFKAIDLAVCSRIEDYQTLTSRLDLRGAIVLQPLNQRQIDGYLNRPELTGLREVMRDDHVLSGMTATPFLLNTMTYAYWGASSLSLRLPSSENEALDRRFHLFDTYVEKRVNSQAEQQYSLKQTGSYLAWLATYMKKRGSTEFSYGLVDQDWLSTSKEHLNYTLLIGAVGGLVGAFVIGFVCSILVSFQYGLGIAVIGGICLAITSRLSYAREYIRYDKDYAQQTVQNIRGAYNPISISRNPKMLLKLTNIALGLEGILSILFFVNYTLFGFIASPVYFIYSCIFFDTFGLGIPIGLLNGLNLLLFNALIIVSVGQVISQYSIEIGFGSSSLQNNNNIIWGSKANAIRISIIIIFSYFYVGVISGGIIMGIIGFGAGIVSSTLPYLQKLILHILLYRAGHIPWNYTRFLDYCASIGLLRKVGGGYIFAHRYLLEYFAELDA